MYDQLTSEAQYIGYLSRPTVRDRRIHLFPWNDCMGILTSLWLVPLVAAVILRAVLVFISRRALETQTGSA